MLLSQQRGSFLFPTISNVVCHRQSSPTVHLRNSSSAVGDIFSSYSSSSSSSFPFLSFGFLRYSSSSQPSISDPSTLESIFIQRRADDDSGHLGSVVSR
uniref:Uncharacterized protein n=1 Tax=Cucumis sativus TaxID=3659 RepID=A0A0A0KQE1_CUCSA